MYKKDWNIDDAEADTPLKYSLATQKDDVSERKRESNISSILAKDTDKTSSSTVAKSKKNALPSPDENKYRDYSLISDEDAVADIKYDNLRRHRKEVFPVKLHKIIKYSKSYCFFSIIS